MWSKFFAVVLGLGAVSHSHFLYAWGDTGHQAIAEIASRHLTPKARDLVHGILGIDTLPAASIFSDTVRSDDRFKDFSPYHFVEVEDGFNFDNRPARNRPERDAAIVISTAKSILTDEHVSRERKMLTLKYFIHMVGDVAQPLHVGNGVDTGGNACYIRWKNPTTGLESDYNLHSLWDTGLFDVERVVYTKKGWFGYREIADVIEATPDLLTPQELRQTVRTVNFSSWYDDTRQLHKQIYPDNGAEVKSLDRLYCRVKDPATGETLHKDAANYAPHLDINYGKSVLTILRRQVLKGGLRLAYALNAIAESANVPKPEAFESILDWYLKGAVHKE